MGNFCNDGVVVEALSSRRRRSNVRVGGRDGINTLCPESKAVEIESTS